MGLMTGIFGQSSSGATSGGGGGVSPGVKGLQDPNATREVSDPTEDLSETGGYGPSAPDLVTVLAAPLADVAPSQPVTPMAVAAPRPQDSLANKAAIPTVDKIDPVKPAGTVDQTLYTKAEDANRVGAAQTERMSQLKENAASLCKPGGTDASPAGQPSVAGSLLGMTVPSPVGLAAAAGAGYMFGPAGAATVVALDTASGIFNVARAMSGPGDVALKGQGTYSDAKTSAPLYGYGEGTRGQKVDPYSYAASPRPIEQLAHPTVAPVALDDAGPGRSSRLSADALFTTSALSGTSIRLGPSAQTALAGEMAQLRREMEKTDVYTGFVQRSANTPIRATAWNVGELKDAGVEEFDFNQIPRGLSQIKPPSPAFA